MIADAVLVSTVLVALTAIYTLYSRMFFKKDWDPQGKVRTRVVAVVQFRTMC